MRERSVFDEGNIGGRYKKNNNELREREIKRSEEKRERGIV